MDHGSFHINVPIRLALNPLPDVTPAPPRRRNALAVLVAAIVLVSGLGVTALVSGTIARVALAGCSIALAAAAWAWIRRVGQPPHRAETQPASIIVDEQSIRLAKPDQPDEALFALAPGFGLALLTNADRTLLAAALTTHQSLLCIGTHIGPIDRRRFDLLLPHAVTVSRDDLLMATHCAHGSLMVESTSLLRLMDVLTQLDGASLGRLVLTDHHGREVLLDRDRLTTPLGTIRLDQPFEWRALRFHEAGGLVDAEFQGTWVRQGMQELVFVSLMTGDLRDSLHELRQAGHRPDGMLRQDARLAHGSRSSPPPLEQRIAVDRLFMLSLRRALDAGHVETRDSIPGDASIR